MQGSIHYNLLLWSVENILLPLQSGIKGGNHSSQALKSPITINGKFLSRVKVINYDNINITHISPY